MANCRKCGDELIVGQNWYPSDARDNRQICNECKKAYKRQWRKEHPGYDRRWRIGHHSGVRESDRQWRRGNPGRRSEQKRRRRALVAGAPINDLTDNDWQAVLTHYNHKCVYCGATEDLTQDHIIPLIRGGPHTISNVAPACRSCNSRKGARTPAEAEMYLWQLPLTRPALDI